MADVKRKIIKTAKAAQPAGPFNQAVAVENTVYVSACLGLDKDSGALVEGGVKEQAEQALHNLHMILRASCSGYSKVLKTTIMLANIDDFQTVNEVYNRVFEKESPARTAFQAILPNGALVAIDCIALSLDPKNAKEKAERESAGARNNGNNGNTGFNGNNFCDDDDGQKRSASPDKKKGDRKGDNCEPGCPGGKSANVCKPGVAKEPKTGPTTLCANKSCPARKGDVSMICEDGPGFGSGSVLNRAIEGTNTKDCPDTCGGKFKKSGKALSECPDTCTGKAKKEEAPPAAAAPPPAAPAAPADAAPAEAAAAQPFPEEPPPPAPEAEAPPAAEAEAPAENPQD